MFNSADKRTDRNGLGDQAFYDAEWHRVRARKGDVRIQVACTVCQGDEQATLRSVAERALSHV